MLPAAQKQKTKNKKKNKKKTKKQKKKTKKQKNKKQKTKKQKKQKKNSNKAMFCLICIQLIIQSLLLEQRYFIFKTPNYASRKVFLFKNYKNRG